MPARDGVCRGRDADQEGTRRGAEAGQGRPPELITELVDKEFNRDMGLKAPKEIEEAEKNLQQVAKNQSVA